ncbi:ABC transporter substrate-binding protein [Trueperella pyogenes]|uniref:ABC transporter substrate-binding protein n=1 Tax=Trueperella pyogenes TaxID=1661 RepID=UPI0032445FE8
MRKVSRLGVGACAAMLAFTGLTGCSASSNQGESASEKLSISFMVLGASQESNSYLQEQLIPKFEEETGISVTLQSSDWGSAFQKITTAAASNQLSDVMVLGSIWTAPLAEKGVLLELDKYVEKWEDGKHIFPKMLEDGMWKGKQYSIPFGVDLRAPIYRADILKEAGVDIENLPTTWSELRTVAEKVKETGKTESPIWWGLDNSIGLQQGYAQLMLQNNAQYWNGDGTPNFDSKESREALEFLTSTFKDELSNYNYVYSGNGPRPLGAGQSAIGLGGVTEFANARQNIPEAEKNLIVGPPIKGPSASEGSIAAWVNKLAIAKGSKNPDAAWTFVKYLMKKENLSKFDDLHGQLPPRDDMTDETWLGETGKALMGVAQTAKSQPPHPGMMQFGKKINELLQPAIRDTATIAETLEKINHELTSFSK